MKYVLTIISALTVFGCSDDSDQSSTNLSVDMIRSKKTQEAQIQTPGDSPMATISDGENIVEDDKELIVYSKIDYSSDEIATDSLASLRSQLDEKKLTEFNEAITKITFSLINDHASKAPEEPTTNNKIPEELLNAEISDVFIKVDSSELEALEGAVVLETIEEVEPLDVQQILMSKINGMNVDEIIKLANTI